jgi:EpsI family protein
MTTVAAPPEPLPSLPPAAAALARQRLHLALAGLLMLCCLAFSVLVKPTNFWGDVVGAPNLAAEVPSQFGDWVQSPYGVQSVVNPQQQEAIDAIYNETLARIYIHKPTGRTLMLSLAYGKDQSRNTQLHPPEACYGGNGFRIDRLAPVDVDVGLLKLPVMRMDAVMGVRHEFVTYWMRVGEQPARGSYQRNLLRMQYALKGYIVDGLLFRVSEITRAKPDDTYALQDRFMRDLLAAMPRDKLHGYIGTVGP